jgi:tetratricopeptide (TPR) repeat protein
MKKWIITGLVAAALILAAVAIHLWLPKILPALKAYKDEIAAAVAILGLIGGVLKYFIDWWRDRDKKPATPVNKNVTQSAQGGGVNAGDSINSGQDTVARDKITNIYNVPVAAASTSLHGLPAPPGDFTGRSEEVRELMEAVGTAGATISGLVGLGGVGKTALALKLAEQLAPRYPDAQFYLDLKGVSKEPLTSKAAMEHIIRAYHPDAKLPESETELAGLYRSVLHDQRALLLMDNARDAQQIELLIPPPSCMLLVTSRQHFTLPGLVPKNLDVLSPSDARALLVRIAHRLAQEKKDYASDLAKLCGYLPLALRSVASALAARINLSPADCAHKLADAQERLKLTATEASLDLSYNLLTEDLQRRFRALAVFPDSFDAAGAAAVWEAESNVAEEALGELLVYSLLEFNPANIRYRLHDLVRAFADARLDDAERMLAQLRHAGHYKDVLAAAGRLYFQGGESVKKGLALFDVEWGNIQTGQAWAATHASEDDAVAQLCGQYPVDGADCLNLRLHPRELIRWTEAGLVAARQLKDRRAEGAHLGNLGNAFGFLGEHRRTIKYYEQSLQIAREIGDRHFEGLVLGNLGVAYRNLGEYHRAIEFCEQSLQIAQEIGDRRAEGNALGNLGTAYHSLNEYRRAIEFHEQRLQIARGSGDRHGEGQALGNLGTVYYSMGEYRRAIDYSEEDLKVAREVGDRRGEEATLGNLGNAYSALGEFLRAIDYYERQLQIASEIGYRSGEGVALWNMSLDLDKVGHRAKAIANAEAALNIFEQIEDPGVETVRKQLAEWRGKA